jgi:seryl-tRNA(Sec) selenium transferase
MSVVYEQDFHAWLQEQAALLKAGRLHELDVEHLVEEIESMGASERRELLSRLQVLILHLLKHQYQPARRSKSWLLTITHQRTAIERLVEQSPSLKRLLTPAVIQSVYEKAIREALIETDLERYVFPADCDYSLAQLLDDDYLPN